MLNLAILFTILLSAWLVLSGVFSPLFVSLGAASCLFAVFFYKILYKDKTDGIAISLFPAVLYCLWMVKEIAKSSLDVSLKMWQLEPDISPQTAIIPTNITNENLLTVFANSITLTPGTVTIGVEGDSLHVHALTIEAMEGLKQGAMLDKINKLEQK